MKKTIGIIARIDKTINNNNVMVVNKKLIETLDSFDVIPLIIAPPGKYNYYDKNYYTGPEIKNNELNKMMFLIKKCNGIILQGGNEFYDFDLKIIDYLYKNNIPTLGICLGMQAMSFYGNGKYKDIGNLSHYKTEHYVDINKKSKLYEIVKKDRILVNSRHKCFVFDTKFTTNAISDDNLIEGIEDKNKKFFIGLQWHPEAMDNFDQKKIIQEFISSCY